MWTTLLFLLTALGSDTLTFEDATSWCGLQDVTGDSFALGDFDADGDPDLLVAARRLFRNDSDLEADLTFVDVTGECGLRGINGGGACWCDIDLDGTLDIITNSGQIWLGSTDQVFHEVSQQLGLEIPRGRAAAIGCGDLDGDGYLEVFTGGGEIWEPFELFPQTLWHNESGGRLTDISAANHLTEPRYGRAIVWCDYDWDGDADLYSGNYRLQPNALFRNDSGRLNDVAPQAGVTGRYDQEMFTDTRTGQQRGYRYGHTIAASWADLTNDGYFDLWVSNLAHKAIGKVSEEFAKVLGSDYDDRGYDCDDSNLFINQGPPDYQFRDQRQALGIPALPVVDYGRWHGDELWSNAACADADNDGWVDVYVNQVYVQQRNANALLFMNSAAGFRERHAELPLSLWGGYGAAWADVDSDGHLDLVAGGAPEVSGRMSVHLLHNLGRGTDWLGLRLVPGASRQVAGSKVLLIQEKQVQLRQVETSCGSQTQRGDGRIHFGLGTGGEVVAVLVYWPDGRIDAVDPTATGTYVAVTPGSQAPPRAGRISPSTARAGVEREFRLSAARSGWHFLWDFGGSRHPEQITTRPRCAHTFSRPGEHVVRVTVVPEVPGPAAEVTEQVKVFASERDD